LLKKVKKYCLLWVRSLSCSWWACRIISKGRTQQQNIRPRWGRSITASLKQFFTIPMESM
jgi:hypothetical protein